MLGTYEDCKRLAASHRCATCQTTSVLVNRWNGQARSYEVLCLQCGNGENFARPESYTSAWRRDPGSVPLVVANNLERKYGVSPLSDQQLVVTDPKAMQERIKRTRFIKDLTAEQTNLLAEVAIAYGLDPAMSELIIYEGRPYVTAEGLVRVAHRSANFAGIEDRPMTADEREAYGYDQPCAWIARVYRSDWKVPATGTGTADAKTPYRSNVIERQFPQRMARVRAIRQALKLAFPNSLPFLQESAEERGFSVDRETGEISGSAVEAAAIEAAAVRVIESDPAAQPGLDPAANGTAQPEQGSLTKCADCGGPILGHEGRGGMIEAQRIITATTDAYKRALCWTCAQDAKAKAVAGTPA